MWDYYIIIIDVLEVLTYHGVSFFIILVRVSINLIGELISFLLGTAIPHTLGFIRILVQLTTHESSFWLDLVLILVTSILIVCYLFDIVCCLLLIVIVFRIARRRWFNYLFIHFKTTFISLNLYDFRLLLLLMISRLIQYWFCLCNCLNAFLFSVQLCHILS